MAYKMRGSKFYGKGNSSPLKVGMSRRGAGLMSLGITALAPLALLGGASLQDKKMKKAMTPEEEAKPSPGKLEQQPIPKEEEGSPPPKKEADKPLQEERDVRAELKAGKKFWKQGLLGVAGLAALGSIK